MYIKMKLIAALLSVSIFNLTFATKCRDGSTCPGSSTCCLASRGVACCPYPNANCCGSGSSCCPRGTKCSSGGKKCVKGESDFFTIMSAPLSDSEGLVFMEEEDVTIESSNFNKLDA